MYLISFGEWLAYVDEVSDPIKCVSINTRPHQARPTLLDLNSNQPHYYPLTVSVNKCGESCNTIDNLYA